MVMRRRRSMFGAAALLALVVAVGASVVAIAPDAGGVTVAGRADGNGTADLAGSGSGVRLGHSWSTAATVPIDFDTFTCAFAVPELPRIPNKSIAGSVFPWCGVQQDSGVTRTGDTSFGVLQPVLMFGNDCVSGHGVALGPGADPEYWKDPYWYWSSQYVYPDPVGSVDYTCTTGPGFTARPGDVLVSVFTRDRSAGTIVVDSYLQGHAEHSTLVVAHPWDAPTQSWSQFDHHFLLEVAIEVYDLVPPFGWPRGPRLWPVDLAYTGPDPELFYVFPIGDGPPPVTCSPPVTGGGMVTQRCVYDFGGVPPPAAACSAESPTIYFATVSVDDLTVLERRTNTITGPLATGVGPTALAMSPDGRRLYIVQHGESTVSVVDTATNEILATIPAGAGPNGITVAPDGATLFVTDGGTASVTVIDTATNAVRASIPVGHSPTGIAVSPDGTRVYVVNRDDRTVSVIDTATNSIAGLVAVGSDPQSVAVFADGTRVLVVNRIDGTVSVIDARTLLVASLVPVGVVPWSVATTPDGRAWVTNAMDGTVSVVDIAAGSVLRVVPVGGAPKGIAATRDGAQVLVVNSSDATVSVIDAATTAVVGTHLVGLPAETLALCDPTPDQPKPPRFTG